MSCLKLLLVLYLKQVVVQALLAQLLLLQVQPVEILLPGKPEEEIRA